jgi:hypothetical protein
MTILVNDPYPFELAGWEVGDPYLRAGADLVQAGQYMINYDSFVEELNWGETIFVREE